MKKGLGHQSLNKKEGRHEGLGDLGWVGGLEDYKKGVGYLRKVKKKKESKKLRKKLERKRERREGGC